MSEGTRLALVVDDEPDMCWVLEQMLRRSGFTPRMALDGCQAIELLRSEHFQIVFIDIGLTDMGGDKLVRQVQEIDPGTRIIMMSGSMVKEEAHIRNVIQDGLICDFIPKPFLNREVMRAIERACSPFF